MIVSCHKLFKPLHSQHLAPPPVWSPAPVRGLDRNRKQNCCSVWRGQEVEIFVTNRHETGHRLSRVAAHGCCHPPDIYHQICCYPFQISSSYEARAFTWVNFIHQILIICHTMYDIHYIRKLLYTAVISVLYVIFRYIFLIS